MAQISITWVSAHEEADTQILLYNNNPPTESQTNIILDALRSLSSQLEEIQRTIFNWEGTMADLKEQRDAITLKISQYQRILNPIRTVPDHVLRSIFRYYVDANVLIQDSLDPSHDTAWKLGQVCYLWRQVVLSSPSLWSDVTIRLPSALEYGLALERMQKRLTTHLSRAKGSPLTISLNTECTLRPAIPFMAIIASHSENIIDLCLMPKEDNLSVIHSMSSMVMGLLPLLQRLTVDFGTSTQRYLPLVYPFSDGFSIAPQLREVTIFGDYSNLPSLLELPWDQIACFRSRFESSFVAENPYTFVPRMTNLQEFFSRRVISHDVLTSSIPYTTLHHLQKLCLQTGAGSARAVNELLGQLDLPNLRELELHRATLTDTLRGFLSRHSSTLTFFSLTPRESDHLDSDDTIIGCMKLLPGLHALALDFASQPCIDALSEVEHDTMAPILVPNLRSLKLRMASTLDDDKCLIEMVETRMFKGLFRILVLDVDLIPDLNETTTGRLQELLAEGLLFEELSPSMPSSVFDVEMAE
ncbi:hypothetical protein VNI00_014526 [Paramarasmius palmivorus]|uniref:F-box domain-containing protein n=1 Tax=Paramarasmius palmivorus TaxID=297713 RepID=A0AAW0BSC7_9AGAR